ncbi:hypothetical protein I3760_15G141100 [Carya illinoinensis]|nr:hypothetical protein I3760_15G141100 [Carya illinoinensis]KAG2668022.1 hypothetical protein I3760_15G141100 [Carya illinoinensis]
MTSNSMAFQFGASSSSSPSSFPSIRVENHDVFLNFRGEDVRDNFISHLYKALDEKGIDTYIDYNLERGEEISPALFKAIEGSMISIVVFSKNYAGSRWCLDELLKILDCKETIKQIVIPIFFKVDPSEVRHQKENFGKSFDELGDKLKDDAKMVNWKKALEKVADLAGFRFPSENFRDESECIQKIVEQVSRKLPNRTRLHVADHPVGLESRAEDIINTLLGIEIINETRMIGIFGIGGIGKTTIAKEVYNRIASKFEGSCFLANVRENSKPDKGGQVKLQEKILSNILRVDPKVEVDNVDQGIILIQEKLCCKKILLILDDVDDLDQLKYLSGRSDWFGLGSRIIITTRDEHLLVQHDVGNWKYPMNKLDHKDALKLFSWHAFKRDQPDNDFVELTKLAMQYAGGLPLALIVVGSNLGGRDRCFWESELKKYERIQHKKIYDILKISFDGLDDLEQNIFLDIACFFKRHEREYVTKILDSCGFFPDAGIKVLKDKCLITIDQFDRLWMHDLLEDMGKEIVRQESPKEPGKRSRLWFYEDVHKVLEKNKVTEQIEGILIKMPLKDNWIRFDSDVFAKMEKLRILIVSTFTYCDCGGLNYLSNELRVLKWFQCPLKFLPSSFHGEKLIFLDIGGGNIRDLGTGLQSKNLTSIDLSFCEYLTNISDLSSCSNLEMLMCVGCKSLVEVHDSVGFLDKLVRLDFSFCFSLKKLPRSFKLRSLELLKLDGYTSLENFPEIECEMKYLKCVQLRSRVIQELPSSITYLTGLNTLYINDCDNFVHCPVNIFQLEHLQDVSITCPNFVNFGKEVGHNGQFVPCTQENDISSSMELSPPESNNLFRTFNFSSSLRTLNLSFCGIVSLPPFIEGFVGLSELDLTSCRQLEEILHLPPNIQKVNAEGCYRLKSFLPESNNLFREFNFSSRLRILNLYGSGIVSLPPCIERFVGLSKLVLSSCLQLEEILQLPPNIESVEAFQCVLLERFPHVSTESSFGISDLKRLRMIDLSKCNKVEVDVGNHAPDPLLVQERFQEKDSSTIIYPGSRIPEWFKYCKETTSYSDSIEIEIDHNASMCCGHQIVALVLCFVVGPLPTWYATYTFTVSRNGQRIGNDNIGSGDVVYPQYSSVCLKYIAGNSIDHEILSRSYREGNNNLRFTFESNSEQAIFKSAGVHLIYGNDNFINPIQLSKRYPRDDGEHDLEPTTEEAGIFNQL